MNVIHSFSKYWSLFCLLSFLNILNSQFQNCYWYKVRYVKLHEKYDDNQFHHDIAIVTVETPFDFRQKNVALIQMENQYQIPKKGDFCRIAGKHVKVFNQVKDSYRYGQNTPH